VGRKREKRAWEEGVGMDEWEDGEQKKEKTQTKKKKKPWVKCELGGRVEVWGGKGQWGMGRGKEGEVEK